MTREYSIETCKTLEARFHDAGLYRPIRLERYDAGRELVYDVTEVAGTHTARVRAVVETFVGGGFAGQVYRVKVTEIHEPDGAIKGLEVGGIYAMKILIPPSTFSRLFRNAIYWMGFQGPFQLQVNPRAARAGALWQKFIRRGAKIRFGDEKTVVDIYATFVDHTLGSCGEFSEWVDGRTWRLEVDDHLDFLKKWRRGRPVESDRLGSPEYRAKYEFMHKFVALLHDMGGHEFARQYEWSTCKSQPNCLKRKGTDNNPSGGLVAVDFRAGLALLMFLPMSPGDFKLIIKGLGRGSLVQFDRGSIEQLERFIEAHPNDFADMREMLDELKASERIYRDSVPDITHNFIRLFYSGRLWSTLFDSAVNGWKVRNVVDDSQAQKLRQSKTLTILFYLIGIIPIYGISFQRFWGHGDWRKHYKGIVTSWDYLKRAFRGKMAEKIIGWHRANRIDSAGAISVAKSGWRFMGNCALSILPAGLHRILTDWEYAKERFNYLFVRPIRLYFNSELRKQWLYEMVSDGRKKHILSHEDAEIILSQVDEPFIQKYLKSLAVHICTLPVTQIVSVLVAMTYVAMHPEMPRAQAWGIGLGIIALFQVVPISPGSLVRGIYVLYLVIRERNFKDYNIAVFLGFFKYIGYLAFPIQMAYRYPVLARFMAGHWANESVHIVPVFGESGALLEHWVFCLFYNLPLTIRRRIGKRVLLRASMPNRYWHIGLCAIAATGIFGIADFVYLGNVGNLPDLRTIWWLCVFVPMLCGAVVTLGCGGATLAKRIVGAAVCGVAVGVFYAGVSAFLGHGSGISMGEIVTNGMWRIFVFSIFSVFGAIITEVKLPDPDL
ncbi:MAG: hypothetical protein JRF31_06940 [Deltaproteobacteria bacterium]|nr:hypothetical protein [Deltaproteobacteria bacterium]MBW2012339.1 hypothetical protein [Deltaproteobacteria bacterium]MBW2320572.1 hypothetical protein [Deltaproteobacteria bacterium]